MALESKCLRFWVPKPRAVRCDRKRHEQLPLAPARVWVLSTSESQVHGVSGWAPKLVGTFENLSVNIVRATIHSAKRDLAPPSHDILSFTCLESELCDVRSAQFLFS